MRKSFSVYSQRGVAMDITKESFVAPVSDKLFSLIILGRLSEILVSHAYYSVCQTSTYIDRFIPNTNRDYRVLLVDNGLCLVDHFLE